MGIKKIQLLLIEDNETYAELVAKRLAAYKNIDIETVFAVNLMESIERLDNSEIDLVLLDLNLPESQGLNTFKRVHQHSPDIPVIVLTATEDDSIGIQAVKLGAQDYLIKSEVNNDQLTRSIRHSVERQREINKRKQIEHDLAQEKEMLAVTLSSIGDGVITTDTRCNVVMMNGIAQELAGWSQSDAAGKSIDIIFNIINDRTGNKGENPVSKAIQTNDVVGLENGTILISKGRDSFKFVSASCSPIRDKDEIIIGAVLVFRDITNIKKMEEELLKSQRLESIGVLSGGIAHDLNNLLTAIMGNISISKIPNMPGEKLTERLGDAQRACHKANDLATQLLTFSKGGGPVKKITSSLELVINDTVSFSMSGTNIQYDIIADEKIWPVDIDQGQISQVISNILINASQAMTNEGQLTIKLENVLAKQEKGIPLRDGRYLKTTIQDEGIGIPKEYLSKIFDPYFTTKQSGSGLGLATSYSIIKNHGGYLTVESELHKGTKVYIYLPATFPESDIIEKKIDPDIKWGQGRILIMDDKVEVREAAGEMLAYIGYQAEYAKDGSEALKLYQEALIDGNPFDTVIIDLTIPGGMGGEETLQKLRIIDPEIKAVVSSGYSNDPILSKYKKHGFKGVLPKPYEVENLSAVLHDVLGKKN